MSVRAIRQGPPDWLRQSGGETKGHRRQRCRSERTPARPLRIVLAGPLPPPIGGTTVLFQRLTRALQARDDVQVVVVNTSRGYVKRTPWSYALAGLRVLTGCWRAARWADVITFHPSMLGALAFSPFVHAISRLYGKPWILRKFGGSFHVEYSKLPPWLRAVADATGLSADLCLFETRQNVDFFRSKCAHGCGWYPNNVPRVAHPPPAEPLRCRRFVFCGQVMPIKGIGEIIRAAERLAPPLTVDIYGPLRGGLSEESFVAKRNVRYCGVIEPARVLATLRSYDAMLLPTYYPGEGYPTAIIEAYCAGIPVIATRWRALPEMVDETSGILVAPRSADELLDAMRRLSQDDKLYGRLSKGAAQKAALFATNVWTERFVEHCRCLAERTT